MKKLIFFLALTLVGLFSFGQATPAGELRISDATTVFGINIPIGMQIYCVSTGKLYVCKTAAASTLTLTTGAANFTEISTAPSHDAVTLGTTNGLSLSGQQISLGTSSSSTTGALNSTDWNTFNSKLGSEVDGSITNEGSLTVGAGAANTSTIVSNTSGSTAVTVSGGTNISITEAGSTITIATTGLKTAIVEDFEQAADSLSGHCYFQLTQTPSSGTIAVQLNGMNLKPTTQYTIVSNKLRIGTSVYKYDQVSISYAY